MQNNRDNVFNSSRKILQLTTAKMPTTCKRDREQHRS
jgi:hypothetical protein